MRECNYLSQALSCPRDTHLKGRLFFFFKNVLSFFALQRNNSLKSLSQKKTILIFQKFNAKTV